MLHFRHKGENLFFFFFAAPFVPRIPKNLNYVLRKGLLVSHIVCIPLAIRKIQELYFI